MIHTLKCPSCSAPVDHDDHSHSRAVRCPFCSNTIVVPETMRREEPRREEHHHVFVSPLRFQRRQLSQAKPRIFLGLFIIVAVFGVIFAVVLFGVSRTVTTTISHVANVKTFTPGGPSQPGAPSTGSSLASVALKFGGEGTGPGYFKDARSIAVDAEGRIYVGEYIGGRVQVFDAAGKFVTQWNCDTKMPLRGMAADRKGTVYVVQRGEIQRYEGATGKPLGPVSYPEDGFDDITMMADGGFVAAYRRHRDDLVRFDSSGKVVKVIQQAISGQTERSELNMRVAVDGTGTTYALGTFNDAVLKFTPDGRYVTRWGSAGDQPGQFRAPHAIAVDNQGRVLVSDIRGVQIFDPNGRYIDTFKVEGPAFGMVFNDKNELFVAARTQVIKYALK